MQEALHGSSVRGDVHGSVTGSGAIAYPERTTRGCRHRCVDGKERMDQSLPNMDVSIPAGSCVLSLRRALWPLPSDAGWAQTRRKCCVYAQMVRWRTDRARWGAQQRRVRASWFRPPTNPRAERADVQYGTGRPSIATWEWMVHGGGVPPPSVVWSMLHIVVPPKSGESRPVEEALSCV